jgi:hypothetical protein
VLGCQPAAAESVADWLRIADAARSILEVAAALYAGGSGPSEAWRLASGLTDNNERLARYRPTIATDRPLLAIVVREWLKLGGVGIYFHWESDSDQPSIVVGATELLRVLALHLSAAVGRTLGVARCSGCGNFFEPHYQPSPGRRSYCSSCRARRVPQRDAERASRARKAETRERAIGAGRSRPATDKGRGT